MKKEFFIPTEAVAALIGFQGQKHRDTEARTSTKIEFVTDQGHGSRVKILGSQENCRLAQQLIELALAHYLASVEMPPVPNLVVGKPQAALDIKTVLFEIYCNKSWYINLNTNLSNTISVLQVDKKQTTLILQNG